MLTPISRDAEPGSRVVVAWTLTYVEAGKRRPFGAGYVFVRLVGPRGSRTPLAYGVHLLRPGGYRARVKVPRGGVSRVEIGMMGSVCDESGCRASGEALPHHGPRLPLARNAEPERARHDLEAGGRRTGLLAVELDRERLVRVHGDDRSAQHLEPRMREVLPAVALREA